MSSATFLDGGGEMGALMRAKDWTATPLGPVEQWPQSLRTTVSTCLNSRFPILIWWGPQLVKLYNDAYREVIASKHPFALGRPGRDVWPEIWDIIGPMLDAVVREGQATWSEDQFLPLERSGYSEECYFTFAYSPIRDESGGVGGVFSVVTETTRRVIGERRLRLLQALAAETAGDTTRDVCRHAMSVLRRDPADVPFALVYLAEPDEGTLALTEATDESLDGQWPVAGVFESGVAQVAHGFVDPSRRAFVVPIPGAQDAPVGVLVVGISPMLAADEQYHGFAGLIAREMGGSVAHARALEDERRRVDALAEIDRVKTAFFANVSHEFRTPLTLMLSPVEDALTSAAQALTGEELATVPRNALRLLKLVNTLLDFARIEAGRARAVFEPTDLAQLTSDLASTFRSAMDRAGLRFDVTCAPLEAPVAVDRDAWEKIVLNLLSNALKFTFDGSVAVSLARRGDDIELRVRDTGVGIPEQDIPRLFDRFHRVQGAQARTQEGSGIGLALANELVKMHGGTVTVESRLGVGTTFVVTIPVRASGVEATPPVSARAPESAARPYVAEALRWLPEEAAPVPAYAEDRGDVATRPLILLADDNADMRGYVTRLLEDRWTVHAVPNGVVALAAARARRPALVISDVMMPVLDGFGLLHALRAERALRDVPVILLSARAGEEASIEGLEAGADDYLVKPFSARELRARVEAQFLRAEIRAIQAAHDRRLSDMFRHAPVAIAMLRGPDHVFEFANDEYLKAIGHRAVTGMPLIAALPELGQQGIVPLLDRVYESGKPYTASSMAVTLNRGAQGAPEQVYFNFLYEPVRDHDGRVDGVAVIAVDVTELVRARQEAEDANRAKDQFLAVLSHELRNPLAPILTATHLLGVKGPDDPGLNRLRETIARQAAHLLKLVEDLLDVGRVITGKLRLERSRVELGALVRQAVEATLPLVRQRHHVLSVTAPEQPVYVDVDAARIVQVLCNLLNNAAKYMHAGGRIDLAVTEQAEAVAIVVRDQGVGIAPQMLERVFERFVQADSGAVPREGLGIGLSIVRTIVELHGGTVAARSDGPGTGSEFIVTLPVEAPSAVAAECPARIP